MNLPQRKCDAIEGPTSLTILDVLVTIFYAITCSTLRTLESENSPFLSSSLIFHVL